ncbi:hypothetical protein SORBI_3008G161601 [Sorghum bicolor]|uniref:Uncharacterized protein n=1 Tax=Sorghum bicolor TaxID=4558 RepID=A0A1Z5R7J3_SORBI|nr:hypothetical protein SORBI_3008G161601 [Sorghum bicolor]
MAAAQGKVVGGDTDTGEWLEVVREYARPPSPRTSCSDVKPRDDGTRLVMAAAQPALAWPDPAPPRPDLPSLPLPLPQCLGAAARVAVAPAPAPSLHSPTPSADPSSSTSTRTTLNDRGWIGASWVSICLGGPAASRGTWFGHRRASSGAVCPLRLHAGANCGTFARFSRGLAGGGAPCSWAPSRLLLGKAQRSLVNATASTSTTSWVIACWWCRCAPPIARVSPAMAPCGVAVTGSSPRPDGCLPVCASLRRGRVQVWLRTVWRRPTRLGIFVGARLPPPRAKSGRGSARCGGGQHPPPCLGENAFACLPSSQASPVWLRAERRRLTFAGALLPSSRATPKGSAWCGGGRLPPQSLVGLWRLWQRF